MMKKNNIIPPFQNLSQRKFIAGFMAWAILLQSIFPFQLLALTGGPSQPEVQSFQPVGTSDMVDNFTGDFKYNIPLMDIEGYPINIAYQSGITMDQEASWVGLGWNINPGVINRAMRGIPDDFDGDIIKKEVSMKPNRTFGLNLGAGLELFGKKKTKKGAPKGIKAGINFGYGIQYNNYSGIGIHKSLNLSISAANPAKDKFTGNLGISSSSDDGLTIQPSLSYSAKVFGNEKSSLNGGLTSTVGISINSRAGLKSLTVGTSLKTNFEGSNTTVKYTNEQGQEVSAQMTGKSSMSVGASGTFDFGMPTFVPQVSLPMQNLSITANFKVGYALKGSHPNFTVGGFYSVQKLAGSSIINPAYGYMHADDGTKYDDAIMDFNREKDGAFTPSTPALPLTNFTYDIFAVSGQGVGGSYRAFRSDMGHVYDAVTYSTSDGNSIGGEVGVGDLMHYGIDFTTNSVNTRSGRWKDNNLAAQILKFRSTTGNLLYEPFYFKEANEKSVDADPQFYLNAGEGALRRIDLKQISKFNTIANMQYYKDIPISPQNYRTKRERRSQTITTLTRAEVPVFGLPMDPDQIGVDENDSKKAKNHHIAEFTTIRPDGARYVYGIAAYNKHQEETSFAVGKRIDGTGGRTSDANTGLVTYASGDNSSKNDLGLDNYYSNTTTPAYAHSYLLSAVLSPDYIDNDGIRGPSDGDLGSYTQFHYSKIINYNWRVPIESNTATFNEGLKSDEKDDKANYLYGEKELWYLDSIVTKNYIAIFTKENRNDGYGVIDRNGGLDVNALKSMKLLRKISLFVKREYRVNPNTAVPVKEVHFEYDYSLCPGVLNNINHDNSQASLSEKGKLTLTKIFFTYQNSNRARFSPYTFIYNSGAMNPAYNIKGYDRWGNFKPNDTQSLAATEPVLSTAEYPYVEQNQQSANEYSQAWNLISIELPSGGKINVSYESDDYAYVQNKRAMQMFKVTGTSTTNISSNSPTAIDDPNVKLYFDLTNSTTSINEYFSGIDTLYFRFLMQISPGKFEYVSGYAPISTYGKETSTKGWVKLKSVTLNDNGGPSVCPIAKATIQYGRINTPKLVWDQTPISESDGFGKDLLLAMANSKFAKNISDYIKGPNKAIYDKGVDYCHKAIMTKSWIRLNNPIDKKIGGGCRVKKIEVSDEWNGMTSPSDNCFSYGQEYSYVLEDGTSSGVATYEPQLGGDENPWKQPVCFNEKKLLVPDDEHYMEEPFGESFFPSPSVGYSRVTVKNIQYANVKHNATGKVVHTFYTSKDFPTIATRTDIDTKPEKNSPVGLNSLLKINVKHYMTASQGYVIELNDMNGKPRRQEVYQENQSQPITSVEYRYKSEPYLNGSFRLNNKATVIYNDGTIDKSANIGVFFDFVSDMREHETVSKSSATQVNIDGFTIPPAPLPVFIPIPLPSYSKEITRFRSAVVTKVIQRFGVLEETIAKDLGSTVATKDLAYDAETGDVLLTQTTTNYNDTIYSLTYPAHWYYDGMGPSYRNIGYTQSPVNINSQGFASVTNAPGYFVAGDELAMTTSSGIKSRGWVLTVNPDQIQVADSMGTKYTGNYSMKVIRSGRRNQQSMPMETMTSLSNPLDNFSSNNFERVISAEALEYTNSWKTFCDCFTKPNMVFSKNPYILGTLGLYKKKKSYLHLTDRTQSNYNLNTNTRRDGIFTSFTPFYALNANRWKIDTRNWTFTSEVTQFSPFGAELENKDALNRYSAATFGFNQTLPTSVAANSRYRDIGFDSFEDYNFSDCADNHFKIKSPTASNSSLVSTDSHTGRTSLKVNSGATVSMTKQLVLCDSIPCDLSATQVKYLTAGRLEYRISGGTPPYTFDWSTSGGDLTISIGSNGEFLDIKLPATGSVDLIVTVTDKNNCSKIFLPYSVTR